MLSSILYGISIAWIGFEDVWSSLEKIGFDGLAIILSLSLFNYLARFIRWDYYLRKLDYKVPLVGNLYAFLASFAFTATPGKVGEIVRSLYLDPLKVSYLHSLSALFVERFIDLIAMTLIAILVISELENFRWTMIVSFILIIIFFQVLSNKRFYRLLENISNNFSSVRMRNIGGHILSMLSTASVLLRSGPLYNGLFLALLAWAAEGYALYIVLDLLGANVSVPLAIGIYGISILIGVISFLPGGLGSTELAMGSMLIIANVDSPIAIPAVIICRLATLWFAVLIGSLVVIQLEIFNKRDSLNDDV
ncbi:MAG: lysylphosphatidylglycerol synthase transmembrane domain-containing protein [Pseudomonadota bacterium]|nr:lysylphosphatidylglycerol synthase transmembrane domain-containing protein [Pseudomonadota bacterium]